MTNDLHIDFLWHDYKYFPYERKLAERELRSLLRQKPEANAGYLRVPAVPRWEAQAHKTTYFSQAIAPNGTRVVPLQAVLEKSAFSVGKSVPVESPAPAATRQSTRYSAHGLHEYRGKFNPQIVRAIGNLLGLQPGDAVLDPFCGSGTTILEAVHNGWNAVGIDANPLAVQIAQAKVAAMHVPVNDLNTLTQRVVERLDQRFAGMSFDKPFPSRHFNSLGGGDWQTALPSLSYLRLWFQESVLLQLSVILREIAALPSADVRLILRTILSDILRSVSMQDEGDLRMRRLANPLENGPAVPLFLSTAMLKIDQIVRARKHLQTLEGEHSIIQGDSRRLRSLLAASIPKLNFAAAITSPPYATALPYIDTQRLSLVLLEHTRRDDLPEQERLMIGTREISKKQRGAYDREIIERGEPLPEECLAFCRMLHGALGGSDGFRRQNTPALLYKYLVDMAAMFREVAEMLRPGTPYALVVGRNQTTLGGKPFLIDTPRLLTLVAEANGFTLSETVELETYARYDVHQANSIRTETLVILTARGNAS